MSMKLESAWKSDGCCERCGKRFVACRYVNGQDVCGCCYADKMGYLAEPHPRQDRIDDLAEKD